jgi:hypothetical protein
MAVTAVAPAPYASGEASNEPEDVTHTCVQCGTTQISTRRPFSTDTPRYRAPDLSPRIAFAKSAGRDELNENVLTIGERIKRRMLMQQVRAFLRWRND